MGCVDLRALGLPIVSNPEADTLSPLIVINFMVPLGDRNCNLLLYFTRKIHSKRSKGSDFNRIVQGSHPHAHTYKPVPINTNLSSNEEAKVCWDGDDDCVDVLLSFSACFMFIHG